MFKPHFICNLYMYTFSKLVRIRCYAKKSVHEAVLRKKLYVKWYRERCYEIGTLNCSKEQAVNAVFESFIMKMFGEFR
jgi:hypothetical protein